MVSKTIDIDLSDCPSCVNYNIRKAMRAVTQYYDKVMAPAGLRGTQFSILTVLSRISDLTLTELAAFLVMERTTLSRNLKLLEKEGYLQFITGQEDRRIRRIKITLSGRKKQKNAFPYWQEAQNGMVDYMGEKRVKKFIVDLHYAALSIEQF